MSQILDKTSSIQVKRSTKTVDQLVTAGTTLKYGEPLVLSTEKVLVIGDSNESNTVDNDIYIAATDKTKASNTLFGADVSGSTNKSIVNKDGTAIVIDKSSLDISHKANQSTIEAMDFDDPTASGTTTSFIATVSQTNGQITATKKTVTTATSSAAGIAKLGATGGSATYEHVHGNLTNDGKIGSTADYAVYTTTSGAVTSGSLAVTDPTVPTTGTTESYSFIDTISQDSKGKISATKKNIISATTTQKGVVKLGATGGAATYEHTHSYAGSTSAGGAANSVTGSLTFSNAGSGAASGSTYNGSTGVTISYNSIGAASSSHTHSYAGSTSAGGAATNLNINSTTADTNYYILGASGTGSQTVYRALNSSGSKCTTGIYFNGSTGVLMGAAWNDIAEFRMGEGNPGECVCEDASGNLNKSNKRLQKVPHIVSDTFGFAIGETEIAKTPIAISGRVLAKPDKNINKFKVGDVVCAGKNGTVSKMNRLEIILFPDRILGKVSEIPMYTTWNNVNINNRIWIQL